MYFKLFCIHVVSEGTKLALEGRHNADTEWLSELRLRGNAQVKECR